MSGKCVNQARKSVATGNVGKIVKCRHELAPPVLLRKLDDIVDCFFRISLRMDLSDLDSSKPDC